MPNAKPKPRFGRVAIAGNSGGSIIAEVAAASFNGIAAVILMGNGRYSEAEPDLVLPPSTLGIDLAACARGGNAKPPTGLLGYTLLDVREFPEFFVYDPDPGVWDAFVAVNEADPCGPWLSLPMFATLQQKKAADITVPVVIINGEEDRVFASGSAAEHIKDFARSSDPEAIEMENLGHILHLDGRATEFHDVLSEWLTDHGF